MNLSKFKKIAQDEKSTTLRHLEGHDIRIVHSALPEELRKQLEGVPMFHGGVAHYDDGSKNGPVSEADSAPESDQKPVDVNVNVGQPEQTQTPVAQQMQNQAPVSVKVGQTPQSAGLIDQNQQVNVPAVAATEQQALREQAAIDAAKGAATANEEMGRQDAIKARALQDIEEQQEMARHVDDLAKHDAEHPINPSHYQENMGAMQRVTTALGLIAGGISSGVTGGPNPAMEFLNKQIDRDIDAQKQNWQNKRTVYGAYMTKYGNDRVASALTKASQLDLYMNRLRQITAQVGTPQAVANLHAAEAKAAMEKTQALREAQAVKGMFDNTLVQAPAEAAPAGGGEQHAEAEPNKSEEPFYKQAPAKTLQSAIESAAGLQPASMADEKKRPIPYEENHILNPDAMKKFKALTFANLPHSDIPALEKQLNGAVQAEKALADIDGTFDKLNQETSGLSGRLHRVGSGLHNVVGDTVSGAAKLVTNTAGNRAYDADKTALLGYVSSALKGTNVHGEQIQKVVDDNAPEAGDPPELVAKKKQNIKHFIKAHTDTSLLKLRGLSKE